MQISAGYKHNFPIENRFQRDAGVEEGDMIARAVVIKVNPGCDVELTRTFEQEVIPRFRKEKNFGASSPSPFLTELKPCP